MFVLLILLFIRLSFYYNFCSSLLSETTASYCKLLSELEDAITRMVFSSYGVEKYFEAFTQSSFYLTKFMKYRVPKENEINMGLVPHIDKTFFGLIDTNTKGLEIETRDGEWINFEPAPNTFLVIAGEIFTVSCKSLLLLTLFPFWVHCCYKKFLF